MTAIMLIDNQSSIVEIKFYNWSGQYQGSEVFSTREAAECRLGDMPYDIVKW